MFVPFKPRKTLEIVDLGGSKKDVFLTEVKVGEMSCRSAVTIPGYDEEQAEGARNETNWSPEQSSPKPSLNNQVLKPQM